VRPALARAARQAVLVWHRDFIQTLDDLGCGLDVDLLIAPGLIAATTAGGRRRPRGLAAYEATRFGDLVDLVVGYRPGRFGFGSNAGKVSISENGLVRVVFMHLPCRTADDVEESPRRISRAKSSTLAWLCRDSRPQWDRAGEWLTKGKYRAKRLAIVEFRFHHGNARVDESFLNVDIVRVRITGLVRVRSTA